jgi:hypothetical protein
MLVTSSVSDKASAYIFKNVDKERKKRGVS